MNFSGRIRKGKYSHTKRIIPLIQRKSNTKSSFFQGTIDYKNVVLLRKFITAEGKILPRRLSGLTAKQQRHMARAIKNSRMVGLLPFINKSEPGKNF
uniref:Small ribosomal subunit protein bS18c n=1 Tax=Lobosphaera incisa TaxID=312850 RepID=A0A097KM62_9CHLO|nr:ribosomal protein S18 [Lobosphaera incisa]AIT94268.1 ribosomal protein S18 [Lobosphaera incisa]AIY30176.1 ribosomal protein S18 [Lobosphaera incisa]